MSFFWVKECCGKFFRTFKTPFGKSFSSFLIIIFDKSVFKNTFSVFNSKLEPAGFRTAFGKRSSYTSCVDNCLFCRGLKSAWVFCGLDTELGGPAEAIFDKMDNAFRAGAQGISLYTSEGLASPVLRRQFKAYANRMRAERAANGGWIPFEAAPAADLDPFAHPGLMAVVERSIQRLAAGEAIHAQSVNGMAPDEGRKPIQRWSWVRMNKLVARSGWPVTT